MIDHDNIRFFGDIPSAQAQARGDAIALESADGRWTYGELDSRIDRMRGALAAQGVEAGNRICWLGANGLHWFEAFFGTIGLRACFAPLNLRLKPAELRFIISDSGAKLLLVTEAEIALANRTLEGMENPPRLLLIGCSHPDHETLASLDSPFGQSQAQRAEDDILLLYTSGTTGLPKGVRLNNANYGAFLRYSPLVEGFDYQSHETVLIVMPLFHVAGVNVSLAGLAHGCRMFVEKAFDAHRVLELIQSEKVAQIFLAPTLIRMLLDADRGDADFSSLRTVSYGASPITEALLAEAQSRMGCQFTQYYGMTESAGAGTYLSPRDHRPELLRSCGKPWPGVEAKIMRPDGSDADPDEIGEIVISGPTVTAGYWNRDEATVKSLRSGWLHTGDAGYANEQGYLFVHDRIKDMIVSGGENVYPAEVENAISGCPGVGDVAVIGVPSGRWGEEVKAVVVRSKEWATPESVIAWARERIADFKAPKSVDFVEELPRNSSGKILRRELRAAYWEGESRSVG